VDLEAIPPGEGLGTPLTEIGLSSSVCCCWLVVVRLAAGVA
jgi:hypothetical protein